MLFCFSVLHLKVTDLHGLRDFSPKSVGCEVAPCSVDKKKVRDVKGERYFTKGRPENALGSTLRVSQSPIFILPRV